MTNTDFIYGVKYDPATIECPHCGATGDALYELASSKTEDGVWFICLDVEDKMRNNEPFCPHFFADFK